MPSPAPTSSLRASIWEWTQMVLLMGNLVWTTLCLGGVRPETMVVTSALTGLLLAVHLVQRACRSNGGNEPRFRLQANVAHWERRRRPMGRFHPVGWWMLPFLVYALANVIWLTPVKWLGWNDWFGWAQIIVVFWVVVNDLRSTVVVRTLFGGLLVLGLVAVAMGVYQRFVRPDWLMMGRTQVEQFVGRSSGSFGIPNSLGALILLLLVPVVGLGFRQRTLFPRLVFGTYALFLLLGLVLTLSRGAWLGLALALAAWPLFANKRSWLWRVGFAGMVLIGVIGVGALMYFALPDVRQRLDKVVVDSGERTRPILWRGAWQIFREHPVTGSGAGSYTIFFERHRPETFLDDPQLAHNEYLNTLSDYGAVGFILFFGVGGIVIGRCLWRSNPQAGRGAESEVGESAGATARGWLVALDDPLVRQAVGIGFLAFGVQMIFDFHFKIPALAMIFATMAGLQVNRTWPAPSGAASYSRVTRFVFGFAVLLLMWASLRFVLPYYRSEAARYGIRNKMDHYARNPVSVEFERELLTRARIEFAKATDLDPKNAQAWADRAYATAVWARHEPARSAELGLAAEGYARRALEQSVLPAEFWLRLGTALDLQGRWVEAGAVFVEAVRLTPKYAPSWYYQAYHLSLKASTRRIAEATIATCLRLDPGNREAEALRRQLAALH